MFKRTSMGTAVAAACGSLLAASPAFGQAQPANPPIQRIEITGTNIKRIDLETSSPVQILKREDIQRSGANSIKELLDQLVSASPTLSDINGSNSFASGASSANLRNLGKTSTLILFNSRRVAPYALADFNEVFTNLDALPLEAVERIEVLKNGASAIYGSDAVAGVINIITRRDFTGVNLKAGFERSHHVAENRQGTAAITGGIGNFDKDGFNLLANLEVFKRNDIPSSREVFDEINPKRIRPGVIPTTFAGQASTFSYPGNLLGAGGAGPIAGCDPALVIGGLCRYDRFERFALVPSADRVNALISGRMRLAGGMEGFAELLYSRAETEYSSPFAPYGQAIGTTTWGNPQTNGAQTFIPRGLPAGHPLNFLGEEEPDFRYRFIDSPAGSTSTSNNYRLQTGVRGAWRNFDWEFGLGFLGSKVDDVQYGNFSNSGFIEVIGDYNAPTLAPDFFNKPGGYVLGQQNSPEVIAKLFPKFGSTGKTTQTVIDGKMSGEIGTMGGGPIGLAVGAEVRREKFTITPTANLAAGDIVGFGLSATDGSRTFSALFGEVSLPVTKALEVQLAARLDKFPNLSANISPKVGVKWRANDAVMWRATAETGFRAANLTETAPSVKFAFNNGQIDPKRCNQALALADDLRTQAAGLPASDPNQAVLNARADIVEQNECAAGVAAIVGNNPDLKPEKSRSFSLGVVLEPTRNLNFTIDYWNITRKDEINIKTADELLAAEDLGLPTGSNISRRPLDGSDQSFTTAEQALYGVTVGSLDSITRGFENLFKTETSGIDIGAAWVQDTPAGKLEFTGLAQYLIKYKAFVGIDNRFGDNLAGTYTYPRMRANVGAALTTGPWINGLRVFHTSRTSLEGDFFDTTGTPAWCAARGLAGVECTVRSHTTVDYYLRYGGIRNLTLGLYVQNLFGKYPPLDFRDQFGTPIPQDPDDVKRRTFRVTAEYKF
jgi:iron complex outermembrane recepter protein